MGGGSDLTGSGQRANSSSLVEGSRLVEEKVPSVRRILPPMIRGPTPVARHEEARECGPA